MPATAAAPPLSPPRTRTLLRTLDSGVSVDGNGPLQVVVEIRLPVQVPARAAPQALVCLAGGGMNRRFFDLMPTGDDTDFSFTEQMCARGFIVVLVDHPGTGDSSRPADVFTLTPERVARADANAVAAVIGALRDGSLDPQLAPLPGLTCIGVGHSMGAMLTVLQQVERAPYRAVALLGFSTAGLPQYVGDEALQALAADPVAVRGRLADLARRQFGASPSTRRPSTEKVGELYAADLADPRGVMALRAAVAPMLPVPAMLAMLPGNIAAECAQLQVPVFVAVGDRDMTGPAPTIPAAFASSQAVTLQVLENSGHSHFLFAARHVLFEQLAQWARSVTG